MIDPDDMLDAADQARKAAHEDPRTTGRSALGESIHLRQVASRLCVSCGSVWPCPSVQQRSLCCDRAGAFHDVCEAR